MSYYFVLSIQNFHSFKQTGRTAFLLSRLTLSTPFVFLGTPDQSFSTANTFESILKCAAASSTILTMQWWACFHAIFSIFSCSNAFSGRWGTMHLISTFPFSALNNFIASDLHCADGIARALVQNESLLILWNSSDSDALTLSASYTLI